MLDCLRDPAFAEQVAALEEEIERGGQLELRGLLPRAAGLLFLTLFGEVAGPALVVNARANAQVSRALQDLQGPGGLPLSGLWTGPGFT